MKERTAYNIGSPGETRDELIENSPFLSEAEHPEVSRWKREGLSFFESIVKVERQADFMRHRCDVVRKDNYSKFGIYNYHFHDNQKHDINMGGDQINCLVISILISACLLLVYVLLYIFYFMKFTILRLFVEGSEKKRALEDTILELLNLHPEYLSANQIAYLEEQMNDWLLMQRQDGLVPPYVNIAVQKTTCKEGGVEIVSGVYFEFTVDAQHSFVFYPPERFDEVTLGKPYDWHSNK